MQNIEFELTFFSCFLKQLWFFLQQIHAGVCKFFQSTVVLSPKRTKWLFDRYASKFIVVGTQFKTFLYRVTRNDDYF